MQEKHCSLDKARNFVTKQDTQMMDYIFQKSKVYI